MFDNIGSFFRKIMKTEPKQLTSKDAAKERLHLVLMQDRTNLTPKILEQMRGELIDLLSRYVELDKELLELNFEQEGEQVALMLSIPVIRAKDEDEIEAALNQESSIDDSSEADECEEEICSECDIVSEDNSSLVSTPEEMNTSCEHKEQKEECQK